MSDIVIQRIHPVRGNAIDVRVDLEDERTFRIALQVAERLGEGELLDESELLALVEESDRIRGYELAVRYLASKPRSAAQMRSYLARREISEVAVDTVIEKLESQRFLSDQEYAESFIREKQQRHPQGVRLTALQLEQRGVEEEIVEEAISTAREEGGLDEREEARRAARKWSPKPKEEPNKARQRLARFLGSRGFPEDVVMDVVEERLGPDEGDWKF